MCNLYAACIYTNSSLYMWFMYIIMYHSTWEVQRHHECYKSHVACCADHSECNILTVVQYVIYKPWLWGVFHIYATWVRGQRKFISGKLSMTEDKGCILCGIHWSCHGSYDIYHGLYFMCITHHKNTPYRH